MNIRQAKDIPISALLERLGHRPVKEQRGEWWYLSPFRQETDASFKLSRDGRAWYDHGAGQGGNILDFVMALYRTDLRGALRELERLELDPERGPPLPSPSTPVQPPVASESPLTITKTQALGEWNPCSRQEQIAQRRLLAYLSERGIQADTARPYVQVHYYTFDTRHFYALGFESRQGGVELRSSLFKGCCGPKDITLLLPENGNKSEVAVFEGFMDFLSAIELGKHPPQMPVIVLNSASMGDRAMEAIRKLDVETVHLYLDHDVTGRQLTAKFQEAMADLDVRDQSEFYAGHKDVNAFLMAEKPRRESSRVAASAIG